MYADGLTNHDVFGSKDQPQPGRINQKHDGKFEQHVLMQVTLQGRVPQP